MDFSWYFPKGQMQMCMFREQRSEFDIIPNVATVFQTVVTKPVLVS